MALYELENSLNNSWITGLQVVRDFFRRARYSVVCLRCLTTYEAEKVRWFRCLSLARGLGDSIDNLERVAIAKAGLQRYRITMSNQPSWGGKNGNVVSEQVCLV